MSDHLPHSPQSVLHHTNRRLNICIVSDFFLPRLGGVELHQFCLAQALQALGHRVIVVTGSYGEFNQRQGIRYLTSGVKVYYCPQISFHNQVSLPTLLSSFAILFRDIVLREGIDIIHGHQTTSPLAHQCIMYGKVLNIPVLFTDHSMFGTASPSSIHVNKLGQFTFTGIDQSIAVSHTLRENIVVRSGIDPSRISVIPNALDYTKFQPDISCQCSPSSSSSSSSPLQLPELIPPRDRFSNPTCSHCNLPRKPDHRSAPTFVFLSRLVYRKGTEFITSSIPIICHKYPSVRFVIGGDGPHMRLIQAMLESEGLTDRVVLLGSVPHHRVRDVLQLGHIFVNTSLTETFCIAILEAICCGLRIIATRVGGVPEVLPPGLVELCDPGHLDVLQAMESALHKLMHAPSRLSDEAISSLQPTPENAATLLQSYDPQLLHELVAPFYSWHLVAQQTVEVYRRVLLVKLQQQPLFRSIRWDVEGCAFNITEKQHCNDSNVDLRFIWESSNQFQNRIKLMESQHVNDSNIYSYSPQIYRQHRRFHQSSHLLELVSLYWKEHGWVSSWLFIWTISFVSIMYFVCDLFDGGNYASYDQDHLITVPSISRDVAVSIHNDNAKTTTHKDSTPAANNSFPISTQKRASVSVTPYGIYNSCVHTSDDSWQ